MSQVFVHLMENQDQDNSLRLEEEIRIVRPEAISISCMPVFGEVATCKNFSVFCSVFFFFFFSLISFFSLFKTILKTVKLPTLCHVFSSIYQLFVRIMISFRHLLIYVHLLTIGIRMNCETRGSNSPQFSCLFIVLI